MDTAHRSRSNQAKFWREPGFADAELMTASYRTHRFPPHAHDEFAIGVIERGAQAFLEGRGRRLIMPQGAICVINPGQLHEGRPAIEGGWDYRMVYVSTSGLLGLLRDADGASQRSVHFPDVVMDDPDTMRLFRAAHICSESDDASQLEKTSRLTAAMAQLVLRHASATHRPSAGGAMPGAVRRARDYIDAHFVDNPSLDAIAQVAGMSAYHLLREFKKAVGVAPHAYLVQRRVAQAKHRVLRGVPLRQVAIEIGYCDQGHLSREFSRFFGVPPGIARQ